MTPDAVVRDPSCRAATVVHARGDLDATAAGALRRVLTKATEAGRPLLLLDMTDVDFRDSAGLAVIVSLERTLRPERCLALCGVSLRMQRMLAVAGIELVIQIHNAGDGWPFPDVPVPAGVGVGPRSGAGQGRPIPMHGSLAWRIDGCMASHRVAAQRSSGHHGRRVLHDPNFLKGWLATQPARRVR